jgi:NAD(P)-dependent dehydrogenase (short-subunit alcohol dehydrogenase family)
MGLLDGKVVAVTGAGSGMGKATAVICAREGAKVVLSDVSGAEDDTAAAIGSEAVAMRCDASDEAQVEALVREAVSRFGRLDAMMNVAGVSGGGLLEGIEQEQFDFIMNVNLRGVFWGTKHAIRAMKENGGGAIINWASLAGLMPSAGASIYSASKAAVVQLTKSTAVEYGHANIRANAMCPGMIATEGMGAQALQYDPTKATRNPLGRAGTPEDAGELAAFLASDRASYLNGVIIPLDGGWGIKLA